VLAMLFAQRRLLAEAMTSAGESTRPQLNNELNKLHALISAEQERRASAEEMGSRRVKTPDAKFDAAAL
jgi:Spy/CpxP family protein refolding chaperone